MPELYVIEGNGRDHHHHHHADEVFTSWGQETVKTFTKEQIEGILKKLSEEPYHKEKGDCFLTKRELSIWENGIVLENRKAYDKNIRHV